MQHLKDLVLLVLGQGAGLGPVTLWDRRRPRRSGTNPVAPVVAGLRGTHRVARCPHADGRGQFGDRGVGHRVDPGSDASLSEIVSKSACSFACTSTTKRALGLDPWTDDAALRRVSEESAL